MQNKDWTELRNSIMGFGVEHSSHKMYYPELQKKLSELNRFKLLFDNISDLIIQVDLDKDLIIETNKSVKKQLDFDTVELVNLPIYRIMSQSIYKRIKTFSLTHQSFDKTELIIGELISKSEKSIPYELSYHFLQENEKYFAVIIARNIQEKLSAEKKLMQSEFSLRAVFDNIYDAIIIHDRNGNIFEVNNQALEMFGFSYSNFRDYKISDISATNEQSNNLSNIFEKAYSGEFLVFEWVSYNPIEKKSLDTEVALRKINWYGRDLILSVIRDITERKKLELNLRNMNVELEDRVKLRTLELENTLNELRKEIQIRKGIETHLVHTKEELQKSLEKEKELNVLKSQFVSMVSHEYRTPLTVILSSTYLLEIYHKHNNNEEFAKHLIQVQNAVHDMTKMLDDVIKIGKISSGKNSLDINDLNLNQVVSEVIEIVSSHDANSHKIEHLIKTDDYSIRTDYKILNYIFINILVNAIKFSPNGTTIKVIVDSDEKSFYITILDNGIGISKDDLKNIYEPFFRANNIGNTPGTGLGLAIVKNSIEMLGGSIFIDSEINLGTKVELKLPHSFI